MSKIVDFLRNSLPWVAIGLYVACSCVTVKAKKEGEETSKIFNGISWAPAFCFFFASIMEMYSGNTSAGTTWLVLGVFNAMVNFVNTQKRGKTEGKENKAD